MPMQPLGSWASSYESKQKDSFKTMVPFWGLWVDGAAQGMQVSAPYVSQGVTNAAVFTGGLSGLAAAKTPVETANILATAWQNWYLATTFPPSPPSPPFLAIASIVPSPAGVAAAYATLLAGLITELAISPPDPTTAFKLKGQSFAALFRTATVTAGVQITGTAPGTPPVPLVLPQVPIL